MNLAKFATSGAPSFALRTPINIMKSVSTAIRTSVDKIILNYNHRLSEIVFKNHVHVVSEDTTLEDCKTFSTTVYDAFASLTSTVSSIVQTKSINVCKTANVCLISGKNLH